MWRILVEQGIKNGKVTLKYHKKIKKYEWYYSFDLGKMLWKLSSSYLGQVQILLNRNEKILL